MGQVYGGEVGPPGPSGGTRHNLAAYEEAGRAVEEALGRAAQAGLAVTPDARALVGAR